MKNILESMNKIDIRSTCEESLQLESLGVVTLGSFWNRITLSGDYWRFYHHTGVGAGVIIKGRKKEFKHNRSYLLPPACDLESFCSGSPEQLFIHAELLNCRADSEIDLIELPEGFEDVRIASLRKLILENKATLPIVRLTALTIISMALSSLPPEFFTAPELDAHVSAVRDYINTRLNEDISLELLARRSGLAEESLLRLFKRECGITPYQYLLQQRYNCAARLLKNSNLPIEVICDTVGVKDRFHFSRQFKKFFGMPPAAYRQHYQQEKH